jgi:hypothetical protein
VRDRSAALPDHPHRPLQELRRVLPRSRHDPRFSLLQTPRAWLESLQNSRGASDRRRRTPPQKITPTWEHQARYREITLPREARPDSRQSCSRLGTANLTPGILGPLVRAAPTGRGTLRANSTRTATASYEPSSGAAFRPVPRRTRTAPRRIHPSPNSGRRRRATRTPLARVLTTVVEGAPTTTAETPSARPLPSLTRRATPKQRPNDPELPVEKRRDREAQQCANPYG